MKIKVGADVIPFSAAIISFESTVKPWRKPSGKPSAQPNLAPSN